MVKRGLNLVYVVFGRPLGLLLISKVAFTKFKVLLLLLLRLICKLQITFSTYSYGKKDQKDSVQPENGKWRAKARFVNPQSLNSWAVLDTSNLRGNF